MNEITIANRSADPFANDRNVTPAVFGEILYFTTRVSKQTHKYSSAVLPNILNNRIIAIEYKT